MRARHAPLSRLWRACGSPAHPRLARQRFARRCCLEGKAAEMNYQQVLENNSKASAPSSATELHALLSAAHDHRAEIRGWRQNPTTGYIELDASMIGQGRLPAFYLIGRHGKQYAL